jgi:ribonuclease HI
MLTVYTDGSVINGHWGKKGNTDPVRCYAGWYALDESGKLVHHKSLDLGTGPNHSGNFAEYLAVRSALYWVVQNRPAESVRLYSDSQLIVAQLSRKWDIHNEFLGKLADACWGLATLLPYVSYNWFRRENNTVADRLSKCLQEKFEGRELTNEEVAQLIQEAA